MASINGIFLRKTKVTTGMEGTGLIADVYMDGRKIGTFTDYADGSMGIMDYVSREAEEKFMHAVFAFGNTHPNEFILNLHKERPEQYKMEKETVRRSFPYITDEEITDNALSNNDPACLIEEIYYLMQMEKYFKKGIKKGYSHMIETDKDCVYYCIPERLAETQKVEGYVRTYASLDDFVQ